MGERENRYDQTETCTPIKEGVPATEEENEPAQGEDVMRIYIAGPYVPKNCSMHDASRIANHNVRNAIRKFIELERCGHEPFVPHLSHFIHIELDEDLSPDFWYNYDLSFIEHWAEAIYMLEGWELSTGSNLELTRAKELGLKIMYQGTQDDIDLIRGV